MGVPVFGKGKAGEGVGGRGGGGGGGGLGRIVLVEWWLGVCCCFESKNSPLVRVNVSCPAKSDAPSVRPLPLLQENIPTTHHAGLFPSFAHTTYAWARTLDFILPLRSVDLT